MAQTISHPLVDWQGKHTMPDFAKFCEADFAAIFPQILAQAEAELEKIASDQTKDLDQFFIDYEASGQELGRICAIFWLYATANSNETIQKSEMEFSGQLARFSAKWLQDARLFAKMKALYEKSQTGIYDREKTHAIERHYRYFLRKGACLNEQDKARLSQIEEEESMLMALFGQHVLKEESSWHMFLQKEDLEGLSEDFINSMHSLAQACGRKDSYALNLSRSMVDSFLAASTRRDLREKLFKAYISRGEGDNEYNNKEIINKLVKLRQEKAQLLGFSNFASWKIADNMAKTPQAVFNLLGPVAKRASAKAHSEEERLINFARSQGFNADFKAYDWRFYAEKLREQEYAFDEAAVKPYFQLDNIINAAFAVATRLFGVTFREDKEVALWHEDARFFIVYDKDKRIKGYFIGDYFARPGKRSGAWMSALRSQHKLGEGALPIIYNMCNFAKAPSSQPSLLSLQDARTLFHEFGHALHGLLSDVTWPSVAGTNVPADFVELPSQLYEHWLLSDFVLQNYARHFATNEPMEQELLEKIIKAKHFNAGFDAAEFITSALFDMYLHEIPQGKEVDIAQLEQQVKEDFALPSSIELRHRPTHFLHIFAGGYSAGYYSYMWSEVLDADAFNAFRESGDIFDQALAERLQKYIYSAGGSAEAAWLYRQFRGRDADPKALIAKRGLAD